MPTSKKKAEPKNNTSTVENAETHTVYKSAQHPNKMMIILKDSPVSGTPSVDDNVKVDVGSMLAQLEEMMRPFADTAIGAAYSTFAPGIVQTIIAPTVIKQLADQAIIMLEGATKKLPDVNIATSNQVVSSVVNLITAKQNTWIKWIDGEIEPFVKNVLTTAGLKF